jgi:hypothetical protein
MARAKKEASKKTAAPADDARKYRNFPKHTLEAALVLPQRIQDEMGGKPMNRLLLADALGMSPSSSNFRELLSSAYKYGLTEGTEKAESISLTPTGAAATQQADPTARLRARRNAALTPTVFGRLLRDYANKKLPSTEMLPKILRTQYEVPSDLTAECASHIAANGRFVDVIRDIGGSPHILLDAESSVSKTDDESQESPPAREDAPSPSPPPPTTSAAPAPTAPAVRAPATGPRPIFVGHGKNKGPLQQLQRLPTYHLPNPSQGRGGRGESRKTHSTKGEGDN